VTRLRTICAGLLGSMWLSFALAQGGAANGGEDQQIIDALRRWAADILVLPTDGRLDPEMHRAGTEMAQEHRARLESLLPQWLAEERASSTAPPSPGELWARSRARFANEIALWFLASGGPAHDAAWIEALQQPGICSSTANLTWLGWRLRMLQHLPAAERSAALAGERRILQEGWGATRSPPPARPIPSQEEQVQRAIAELKSGDHRVGIALPPVLAERLLSNEDGKLASLDWLERCAAHQWSLRARLPEPGVRRDEALLAYRYAMMPLAQQSLLSPEDLKELASAPPSAEYPKFARQFVVEGQITVEREVDASGRLLNVAFVKRVVSVAGIRGVRPVAFETALDDASLARATDLPTTKPATDPLDGGRKRQRVEFKWRLE